LIVLERHDWGSKRISRVYTPKAWAEKQAMDRFGERLKVELALRKLIEEKNQRKRVIRCGGKRHSH